MTLQPHYFTVCKKQNKNAITARTLYTHLQKHIRMCLWRCVYKVQRLRRCVWHHEKSRVCNLISHFANALPKVPDGRIYFTSSRCSLVSKKSYKPRQMFALEAKKKKKKSLKTVWPLGGWRQPTVIAVSVGRWVKHSHKNTDSTPRGLWPTNSYFPTVWLPWMQLVLTGQGDSESVGNNRINRDRNNWLS